MATKNITDLSNFDFGFSVVDENELAAVTEVTQEVEAASSTAADAIGAAATGAAAAGCVAMPTLLPILLPTQG